MWTWWNLFFFAGNAGFAVGNTLANNITMLTVLNAFAAGMLLSILVDDWIEARK